MMYGKMQVEYDDTTKLSEEKKWKKIVYGGMQEGYEDNYTDESFLEDMVMNANVVRRDTLTAMREAVSVAQYVCTVAIVGSVWAYSLRSELDHRLLLSVDGFLFAMGFMVLLLRIPWSDLVHYILKVGFFASTLYVLAPVYQTLTRSISSDTIWALTVFLLLVHLFLHDYVGSTIKSPFSVIETGKKTNPSQDQSICNVINNISLNASIAASVLIASRLPSRVLVFALLLFSLELFLFSPLITHCIKQYSSKVYLLFSFVLMGVTFALVYPLHRVLFFMLVCLVFFVVIVCPYWLVRAQEYKFEINGPWDEAKLCFDITE